MAKKHKQFQKNQHYSRNSEIKDNTIKNNEITNNSLKNNHQNNRLNGENQKPRNKWMTLVFVTLMALVWGIMYWIFIAH